MSFFTILLAAIGAQSVNDRVSKVKTRFLPARGGAAGGREPATAHSIDNSADHLAARGYRRGLALVVLGGVAGSTSGILFRSVEQADAWQVLVYRSISFALFLLLVLLLRYRGGIASSFRAVGWNGVAAGVTLGLNFVLFLLALSHTTVANVMFVVAAAPFMAALLGWLVLREPVSRRTWMAMGLALVGVAVMVWGALALGRWLGNAIALGCALTYAVAVVLLRRGRAVDMMPATCLGGLFAAAISLAVADGLTVSPRDLALSLLLGVVQLGLQYLCFTIGSRYVPAAQLVLVAMVDTVLAPLWVWLGFGEAPEVTTLAGGAVLVVAIALQAAGGLRSSHRTAGGLGGKQAPPTG